MEALHDAPIAGRKRNRFQAHSPFTPINRPNMTAWMASQSDPGETPAGRLPIPAQITVLVPAVEARINRTRNLGTVHSLGQSGSRVISNLLVLPVEETVMYVQSTFRRRARKGRRPELTFVIVATGEQVEMRPTLGGAWQPSQAKMKRPVPGPPQRTSKGILRPEPHRLPGPWLMPWTRTNEGNEPCKRAIGLRMARPSLSLGAFSTRWRDPRVDRTDRTRSPSPPVP